MDSQVTQVVDRRVAQYLLEQEVERATKLKLAVVEKFGEDEYDNGTVVRFEKQFVPDGQKYMYAAIKAVGVWWLTGKHTHGMAWGEFVLFLVSGDCIVTPRNVEFLTNGDQAYTMDLEGMQKTVSTKEPLNDDASATNFDPYMYEHQDVPTDFKD